MASMGVGLSNASYAISVTNLVETLFNLTANESINAINDTSVVLGSFSFNVSDTYPLTGNALNNSFCNLTITTDTASFIDPNSLADGETSSWSINDYQLFDCANNFSWSYGFVPLVGPGSDPDASDGGWRFGDYGLFIYHSIANGSTSLVRVAGVELDSYGPPMNDTSDGSELLVPGTLNLFQLNYLNASYPQIQILNASTSVLPTDWEARYNSSGDPNATDNGTFSVQVPLVIETKIDTGSMLVAEPSVVSSAAIAIDSMAAGGRRG
ncbi:MAG: hypothetical protein M1824_000144 [Vezdaea acicularis]|nr:MAG: hypothetical protein M1824_000144 [Vezdaea acicularis]